VCVCIYMFMQALKIVNMTKQNYMKQVLYIDVVVGRSTNLFTKQKNNNDNFFKKIGTKNKRIT